MPTPDPTLFLVLHHAHSQIDAFADEAGTMPLDEVHVSRGGQINVVFIKNANRKVMAGHLFFGVAAADPTPFTAQKVKVHDTDNGPGGNNSIRADFPASIPADKVPGRYPFLICGVWNNGHHKVDNDPVVVIDH